MSGNLYRAFTDEAKTVIQDDNNWSHDVCPENCAVCKKSLGERVPLHLWKNDGKDMISFHMKCAFGDKVTEPEDDEDEYDPYWDENLP